MRSGSGILTGHTTPHWLHSVEALGKSSAFSTALAGFSVVSNKTSLFDNGFQQLQSAIAAVQAAAQSIGGNVPFLQTRLDFTSQYIVTLQGGASKLTVADVNQESTNLVTLQYGIGVPSSSTMRPRTDAPGVSVKRMSFFSSSADSEMVSC